MEYTCEKCKKTFNQKIHYEKHINRKYSCVPEEKEKQHEKNKTCNYCKKIFADTKCKNRHEKICKSKPTEMEELKQIMIQLNETIKQQNAEIKELKNKPANNVTNINNNNNTINVQQNIVINAFGKEDLSYLTWQDYNEILKKGCYAVSEFVKYIHCNKDKPENMNIYIKNYKDELILTYDGTDWNVEKKDDVISNLIENNKNYLESKYNEQGNKIKSYSKSMFEKYLNKSNTNMVVNNLKDEIKNELYKNRKYIKKPTKKHKKSNILL